MAYLLIDLEAHCREEVEQWASILPDPPPTCDNLSQSSETQSYCSAFEYGEEQYSEEEHHSEEGHRVEEEQYSEEEHHVEEKQFSEEEDHVEEEQFSEEDHVEEKQFSEEEDHVEEEQFSKEDHVEEEQFSEEDHVEEEQFSEEEHHVEEEQFSNLGLELCRTFELDEVRDLLKEVISRLLSHTGQALPIQTEAILNKHLNDIVFPGSTHTDIVALTKSPIKPITTEQNLNPAPSTTISQTTLLEKAHTNGSISKRGLPTQSTFSPTFNTFPQFPATIPTERSRPSKRKPDDEISVSIPKRGRIQAYRAEQCLCEEDCGDQCLNVAAGLLCEDAVCRLLTCSNRIGQFRSLVIKSTNRGAALLTLDTIPKGTILGIYEGEILNRKQVEKISNATYIFHYEHDIYIDATNVKCLMKYINHSCEPNSVMEKRRSNGLPAIIIRALNDILPNSELTTDYGREEPNKSCLCGAKKCRSFF
ncbi:hypothetical protein QBC40DRAFT_345036 [Triangularia verruculosa]|uniref:SET domain-containing protein n=1 Tax=Triangularia verruculosa TaxID=2587418 RepID=A0AAN6XQR0_9PEZI|nr:hypothetical protein QBC40DRAFT_345036 [Triangularia verruculosa]